ncbi:MAG: hypothetical protein K8T90_20205 [Planctomycetes bacterium]|nr:hypothetical protein [Planctomycetota bacterium]
MNDRKNRTGAKRRRRGSALPAILALSLGVGALAAGFVAQDQREHQRETWERQRTQSYLDAWGQMETVADIVNGSAYDSATGENIALRQAAARADTCFVDHDGYLTNVTCAVDGTAGPTGFYRLVSTANVGPARCRITALVRSRQSFADFDYFVNSHSLGISGGADASARHIDAPDGEIHSNKSLIFYFPDRHFVKPVTAVSGFGFQFVSGAIGVGDSAGRAQNNWFWGPSNNAANPITGLTDIDLTTFGARSDNLLNLDGAWDYAKVKLKGTVARVEHWQVGHNEMQDVTTQVEQFVTVTQQQEVLQATNTTATTTVPVYTNQTVQVFGPVAHQRLLTAAWDETLTGTRQVQTQVWVAGGGGGATGGGGGTGTIGYWQTVTSTETYTYVVNHPAVYETYYVNEYYNTTQQVQTGTRQVTTTTTTYSSYNPKRYTNVQVQQSTGFVAVTTQQNVWVPDHKVTTYDVGTNGTIYVTGTVEFSTMSTGSDGFGVQTLDGNLTIASNSDVRIRETIQYAKRDAGNVWRTAYLNGADKTQEFIPNPAYTGNSVLGIIARNDIEIRSDVPDQAEIDGTLMARDGEFRVRGVDVANNSSGDANVTAVSNGFVKQSLRRLGGVISNQRPITTFVDSSNAVTRGFVFTKSIYDTRQRTNPPRGFPTLNRPRIMATLIREIN